MRSWSYALELVGVAVGIGALTGTGLVALSWAIRRTCPECGARC